MFLLIIIAMIYLKKVDDFYNEKKYISEIHDSPNYTKDIYKNYACNSALPAMGQISK